MAKKIQHPTLAERAACLAVAMLAARWCREAGFEAVPVEEMLASASGYIASEVPRKALDEARAPLGAFNSPLTPGVHHAIAFARDAAVILHAILVRDPVDEAEFAEGKQSLFACTEQCGKILGFARTIDAVRLTYHDALATESERAVVPHSPEHALLILRGIVVEKMRTRLALTAEMLAKNATSLGGKISTAQVTRIENGTASPTVARDVYVARALKVDVAWIDNVVTTSNAFAERLAFSAAGVDGERWFAGVAAQDGERSAKDVAGVAVLSTLRRG